jgi:hypothetical protein
MCGVCNGGVDGSAQSLPRFAETFTLQTTWDSPETYTPRSLTEMFSANRLKLEHCIECKLPRVGDFNCIKILLKISHSSCNRRTESDNPRVPCSETCSSWSVFSCRRSHIASIILNHKFTTGSENCFQESFCATHWNLVYFIETRSNSPAQRTHRGHSESRNISYCMNIHLFSLAHIRENSSKYTHDTDESVVAVLETSRRCKIVCVPLSWFCTSF